MSTLSNRFGGFCPGAAGCRCSARRRRCRGSQSKHFYKRVERFDNKLGSIRAMGFIRVMTHLVRQIVHIAHGVGDVGTVERRHDASGAGAKAQLRRNVLLHLSHHKASGDSQLLHWAHLVWSTNWALLVWSPNWFVSYATPFYAAPACACAHMPPETLCGNICRRSSSVVAEGRKCRRAEGEVLQAGALQTFWCRQLPPAR